jgi:UDP-GlcNAc:undecaprenyl-phosphate GlcNAc-1-phosphate transferase
MDAVVTVKGVLAGTVAIQLVLLYLFPSEVYSRSVFIIYAALLMLLHTGSRASFRLISEFVRRRRDTGQRLLIYGAGEAGVVALRELMGDPEQHYRMLGFIDDDDSKRGKRVQGYPVIGAYSSLLPLIWQGAVDRLVVSTQKLAPSRVRELEELCAAHGIALSRLKIQLDLLVGVGPRTVSLGVRAEDVATPAAPFSESYVPRRASGREGPE